MQNELKYTKMLEEVGFDRQQAEAQVKLIEGAMQDHVTTKLDLYKMESKISQEISDRINALKVELHNSRLEMNDRIYSLEHKIYISLAAATTVLTAFIALFKFAF